MLHSRRALPEQEWLLLGRSVDQIVPCREGGAVLTAVAEAMPQFPLDAAFLSAIPGDLQSYWQGWLDARPD